MRGSGLSRASRGLTLLWDSTRMLATPHVKVAAMETVSWPQLLGFFIRAKEKESIKHI